MAIPTDTPVPQMSDQAIEAIFAGGGVSDESAQIHVHEEDMTHLCITLVGTATAEGPTNGFVVFCDHGHG
jgi:hypothetical protein